ncbi:hypothetical protein JG688_00012713 [Phytophthora aleatoria]|uniref:Ion transport domain-containing protein n=1 Tax=Phytophthora aleatoria TaxID=2496075 RepID=A0A8J5IY67_9STRA|nr:hypothetical protein JG688_00012713 [Phytophthora aleatoria]
MEPHWIYFEFLFGFLFTLEIALHVYSHPVRRHLWGDIRFIVNILVLLPFYVEIVEILIGEWPTYSVVPAMPSFFTAIRFLKSLRILKLGTHIPGARVLIRTAQLVTERLAIPVINQFFLMQKVFHETIKDISLLNQLGMERVNTMRKKLSEAATLLADVRLREEVIETKISENMNFCVTACLNFAGMIERILGTERARKPLPATGHTNALLAAADVTNELLQSAKSTSSRRSISGKFPDAMPRLHAKQTFKRMATVSKVLAGPQNRSGRANTKWAEYTNNQNQNQPQPE